MTSTTDAEKSPSLVGAIPDLAEADGQKQQEKQLFWRCKIEDLSEQVGYSWLNKEAKKAILMNNEDLNLKNI